MKQSAEELATEIQQQIKDNSSKYVGLPDTELNLMALVETNLEIVKNVLTSGGMEITDFRRVPDPDDGIMMTEVKFSSDIITTHTLNVKETFPAF